MSSSAPSPDWPVFKRSAERGQATVELALVLPAVVLLALVIVQVSQVAVDALLVQHAAREAARAAAVEPTGSAATAAARGAAGLQPALLSVTLSGGRGRGDALRATVSYTSQTNVPIIGGLIGDIMLNAAVTMRVE